MTCHIKKNGSWERTLCGKEILGELWGEGETYVEELSRRVLEMSNCDGCLAMFHKAALKKLPTRKLTVEQFERAVELQGELQKLGIDTTSVTMHLTELAPEEEEPNG